MRRLALCYPLAIAALLATAGLGVSDARAAQERVCSQAEMRPALYEACEAQRLDEIAATLRAKAAGLEALARQRNPKCDEEMNNPAALVGCDMAVRDMTTEAGFIRQEAAEKEALADRHRAVAEALRAEARRKAQPAGAPKP